MPVLVDSNVLLDVIHGDEQWASWAHDRLSEQVGNLAINPIAYAELCCRASSPIELDGALASLGIGYLELPRDALFLSARAFLLYRQRGGRKSSPLPDFFIGAHAAALDIPILTRDAGRYRTYFPSVQLICP